MSWRSLAGLFIAVWIVLVLVLAPLSLMLRWTGALAHGLAAERISGSIWNGRLKGLSFRGMSLGEAKVALDPLGVFLGGGRFKFELTGPVQADGVARFHGTSLGLLDLDLAGPASALAGQLPLDARLTLSDADIEFRSGQCRRGRGDVRLDQVRIGGVRAEGLVLQGAARCDGAAWVAPLKGAAEGVDLEIILRITADGRYQLTTEARSTNATVEAAMALAGFERTVDGFRRTDGGRLGSR